MLLPKKWGQGQLFAFSALDSSSYASNDFCGMLSGDRIGIRFYSKTKREFALVNLNGKNLEFEAVTSDYICFHFPNQDKMRILYAQARLIIGNTVGEAIPSVFVEGKHAIHKIGDIELHDNLDGELSALKIKGNRFSFAFGHSKEEVIRLVDQGISLDLDSVVEDKIDFYKKHMPSTNKSTLYPELYAK